MTAKTNHVYRACLLFLSGVLYGGQSLNARVTPEVDLTVVVKVRDSTCSINQGSDKIIVHFGDQMLTTAVNGSNYKQDIHYRFACLQSFGSSVQMRVTGTGSAFDRSALHTSKPRLALRFSRDGQILKLNEWVKLPYSDADVLQVVPIQQAGTTLTSGTFNANAVLHIEYL